MIPAIFQMGAKQRADGLFILVVRVVLHQLGAEGRVVDQSGYQVFHQPNITLRTIPGLCRRRVHSVLKDWEGIRLVEQTQRIGPLS